MLIQSLANSSSDSLGREAVGVSRSGSESMDCKCDTVHANKNGNLELDRQRLCLNVHHYGGACASFV